MAKHASPISIEIDSSRINRMFRSFEDRQKEYLRLAMANSLKEVSLRAVGKYMVRHPWSHKTKKFDLSRRGGKLLGIMTGRLSRSILGSYAPSRGGGAEGSREGIEQIEVKPRAIEVIGKKGSRVPYARIHEKGGMAGPRRKVQIPARPYLKPALMDSKNKIVNFFQKAMTELAKSADK